MEAQTRQKPSIRMRIVNAEDAVELENVVCSICLVSFVAGSELTHTKCDHLFHIDCLVRRTQHVSL